MLLGDTVELQAWTYCGLDFPHNPEGEPPEALTTKKDKRKLGSSKSVLGTPHFPQSHMCVEIDVTTSRGKST